MPFAESKRTIYKKTVLDQVICQLKFPPILRIDAELPVDFQEHVNKGFPNYTEKTNLSLEWSLRVKEPIPSQSDTWVPRTDNIKNHEFSSEDGQWKINLARTFLAFSTDSYSVWEDFKKRLEIPLKAFVHVYSPSYFSRIGLRYMNVIQRSALGLDGVDWSKLLKPQVLGILADSETSRFVRDLQSVCEISLADIDSSVRVSTRLTRDRERDEICYVIDSDFFNAQKTSIDEALSGFDDFNQHASRLFQWCITERLHKSMEPKV